MISLGPYLLKRESSYFIQKCQNENQSLILDWFLLGPDRIHLVFLYLVLSAKRPYERSWKRLTEGIPRWWTAEKMNVVEKTCQSPPAPSKKAAPHPPEYVFLTKLSVVHISIAYPFSKMFGKITIHDPRHICQLTYSTCCDNKYISWHAQNSITSYKKFSLRLKVELSVEKIKWKQ